MPSAIPYSMEGGTARAVAYGVDTETEGRWLGYAELAEIRGTDKTSALKLALRRKWPRRKDNHGTMQVCVPPEWLAEWAAKPAGTAPDMPRAVHPATSHTTPNGVDIVHLSAVFETAIASLTDARDQAQKRAEQAELRAEQAETRADRAEQAVAAERNRADRAETAAAELRSAADQARSRANELHGEVQTARIAQAEAEADAAELRQADMARKARGLVARLRGAWRGE